MENKLYAPVIIPTLNRYEHFKRCLESLEACTGADKTDVYVGLDYPPSEKYVDGWKKIDAYLAEKEKSNRFGNLYVIRRKTNCGIGHEKSNTRLLVNVVEKKNSCYISSEDDNEFSPCFIEYMNQNLELYKDDPSVFRICGYLPLDSTLPDTHAYTQFKANRYVAWGVGIWCNKQVDYRYYLSNANVVQLIKDSTVRKYFEKYNIEHILNSIVRMSKGEHILGDVIVDAYLVLKGMKCVLPTTSMVRNHGSDGSGLHCCIDDRYQTQDICPLTEYLMNEAPDSFTYTFEKQMNEQRLNRKMSLSDIREKITWNLYKKTGIFSDFKLISAIISMIRKYKK